MKTLLSIAVYNESRNLPELLKRLRQIPDDWNIDVLFIDDGSGDGTGELIAAAGFERITHIVNLGQGMACNTGMLHATRSGYDVFLTMDGDGQHDPLDVREFVDHLEDTGADVVVGSRLLGEDYQGAPLLRRKLLPWVNRVINSLTGYELTDTMCGFRAYRVSSLNSILPELTSIMESEYTASELFFRFAKNDFKVVEIPLKLRKRLHGSSHKGTVRYGIGILRAIARMLLTR